ncbi:formyltransferase family protein [Amylibacter sp.]|nr:formyltransferase family protein [Amylibacter sp.]
MIKVLFMGRKIISAKLLKKIHQNEAVEIVGVLTDSHLRGSPTRAAADELGLKIYTFESALIELKSGELTYDLGLSILYWRKLKEEFLTVPSKGVINFHPALLPDYKGTGGYNLAILEGLSEWGVSAHYVDTEIDTGELIKVHKFSIDKDNETVVSLEKASMRVLEDMVIDVFEAAINSVSFLETTANTGGRYVSRLEMENMKKIVDGDDVSRKIRAFWFPPYDGAYLDIGGEKFTLVNRMILKSIAPSETTSLFVESS